MKRLSTYLLWIVVTSMGACIDPISFETEPGEPELVFFGNFTQICQDHIFTISRTSEIGTPPTPVTGAAITIFDDLGASAAYVETEPGTYLLSSDLIQGEPGRSYHLQIFLDDGSSYFTEPQIMPEPIDIDDIYFEFDRRPELSGAGILVDKTFIDIFIDTPLRSSSGSTPNLRWAIEEVYSFVDLACGPFDLAETCYFIDPIDDAEVLLLENQGDRDFLSGLRVRTRELVPFDEFTARHYFLVHQLTTSNEETEYWQKVDAVANQSGNLFDVQPAAVKGNILEESGEQTPALGFFGVNGESVSRTFTTPFTLRPNPVFDCNDVSFFSNNPAACCNCGNKPGIQIARPDYWDED